MRFHKLSVQIMKVSGQRVMQILSKKFEKLSTFLSKNWLLKSLAQK